MSDALGTRHPRVQRLRRLARQRSARRDERAFVVEGATVLADALASGAGVEAIYYEPQPRPDHDLDAVLATAGRAGVRTFALQRGVIERITETVTPQPVLGVVAFLDIEVAALATKPDGLVVALVDVRDPGNVGAIVRSADAAGASGVVACAGTGDLYNPKVVRASAGSLFHLPVALGDDPGSVLDVMARAGIRSVATVVSGGAAHTALDWSVPSAIVLGNEAQGLPPELAERCDAAVTIPISGRAESLNVAMAATVLLFEAQRQRGTSPAG